MIDAILALDIGLSGRGAILILIPVALTAASLLVSKKRPESEKLSPYECGFEPVGDARIRFDTFYYTVGILFLLFDLEIVLLLPYAIHSRGGLDSPLATGGALTLLLLLTLGFVYEWTRGALKTVIPQIPPVPRSYALHVAQR